MKIKKSELLALIKEEIKSEMYDDPRMGDVYPEVVEAQKIVDMIMDMSGGDKAAAMEMLKNAMGMLQSEMDAAAEPMMQEGIGAILDPEVQRIISEVAFKLLPLVSFVSIPVLIGALVEEVKKAKNEKDKRGEM